MIEFAEEEIVFTYENYIKARDAVREIDKNWNSGWLKEKLIRSCRRTTLMEFIKEYNRKIKYKKKLKKKLRKLFERKYNTIIWALMNMPISIAVKKFDIEIKKEDK